MTGTLKFDRDQRPCSPFVEGNIKGMLSEIEPFIDRFLQFEWCYPFAASFGVTKYATELFVWFDRPGESSPEKDCCW